MVSSWPTCCGGSSVAPDGTRTYRMTARAEAARQTGDRILAATVELFWERPTEHISLEEVARRAGVTKQTVIRRFGGKEALLAAAADRETERVGAERGDVEPGDVPAAIRVLVAHYERVGDAVLRLLAEESRAPGLRAIADRGRAYHDAWCEAAFAPWLEPLRGGDRTRLHGQLVVVTDVHAWRQLRRDRGLTPAETELALRELVERLLDGRDRA